MDVMLYGWEGNRRSGIALAMRYRLQLFIHLRSQSLGVGDDHPTYASVWHLLPLTLHLPLPHSLFSF